MSDDERSFENADTSRLDDVFAPETVDEEIAVRMQGRRERSERTHAEGDAEGRLVTALAGTYALPAEAEAALARVRTRLRQRTAQGRDAQRWRRERDERETTTSGETRARISAPHTYARRASRVPAALRAVAAVLVVALLAGGFFALLHGRPEAGSASTWTNASISQAHLSQPLDFAPARGLTYAVAATGGAIYACDANHLWYSTDGGRNYAPFPLAYPPSDTSQSNELCNIGAAPGAPGIFVVTYRKQTQIEYAEAGDHAWRTLGMPQTAVETGTGGRAAPLDASDIAQAVSSDLDHHRLRVVGNWVFVLAQAPNTRLVATPDFGTTWYQLDAPLEAQNLTCNGFTVVPNDPRRIFCAAAGANGNTRGDRLWQSFDGGAHWERLALPGDPSILGERASDTYLYVTSSGAAGATDVWRYPLAGDAWQKLAALPNWSNGTDANQPPGHFWEQGYDVVPDGTLYSWLAAPLGSTTAIRVFALPPDATNFTEVGAQSTVAFSGTAPVLEVDDTGAGVGGSRALYLHGQPASGNEPSQPLYRLPLPASGVPVRPDTTSLPQPAPTATATPVPTAACTTATGNIGDIQPGGFGATVDTFDTRWGQHHGAAAGSLYFGPDAASGNWVVSAAEPASNGRIYMMSYRVDPSKTLTLAQAEAIAATILPRDATRTAGPHTTPNGTEVDYCSAALIAAFPSDVQMSVAPLFHDGRIAVTYDVNSAGDVQLISFMEHVL